MSNDNKITLQQLINSIYEIYFQPLPCPLHAFWRFLNAFLGAISIFSTSLFLHFEFVSKFVKSVLDSSASNIFFFYVIDFCYDNLSFFWTTSFIRKDQTRSNSDLPIRSFTVSFCCFYSKSNLDF